MRRRRDIYCGACLNALHGKANFSHWHDMFWAMAKHEMDVADGLATQLQPQQVDVRVGVWQESAPPPPLARPSAHEVIRSKGAARFRAVGMAVRALVRINKDLSLSDDVQWHADQAKTQLVAAHNLDPLEFRAEWMWDRLESLLGAASAHTSEARALWTRLKERLGAAVPPEKFAQVVRVWEAAQKTQPFLAGLEIANDKRTPREASFSTDRSSSRPMLRHRRPQPDGAVGPRHRPTEEELGPEVDGVTSCPACQKRLAEWHYGHAGHADCLRRSAPLVLRPRPSRAPTPSPPRRRGDSPGPRQRSKEPHGCRSRAREGRRREERSEERRAPRRGRGGRSRRMRGRGAAERRRQGRAELQRGRSPVSRSATPDSRPGSLDRRAPRSRSRRGEAAAQGR